LNINQKNFEHLRQNRTHFFELLFFLFRFFIFSALDAKNLLQFNGHAQQRQIGVRVTGDRCYDFLNFFAETFAEKIGVFLTQNEAKLCKILIITLVSEINAIFFAENCQKSLKIVIMTSTLDLTIFAIFGDLIKLGHFVCNLGYFHHRTEHL
jgi:hypothetical protein